MKKKYELIIFDWDGTLMDSANRIVSCMKKAANDNNFRAPKDSEIKEMIGLSLERTISALFQGIDKRKIQAISNSYKDYWQSDDMPGSKLFNNVEKTLNLLLKDKYLLAIATGKSRNGLKKSLIQSGLESFFHATRCADETRSKPDPLMIEEIIFELNCKKENVLMVGDTAFDMEMAIKAEIDPVAVSYGVHSEERLLHSGAKHIMNDIFQLINWLD